MQLRPVVPGVSFFVSLPAGGRLRSELYIDTPDGEQNRDILVHQPVQAEERIPRILPILGVLNIAQGQADVRVVRRIQPWRG